MAFDDDSAAVLRACALSRAASSRRDRTFATSDSPLGERALRAFVSHDDGSSSSHALFQNATSRERKKQPQRVVIHNL